MQKLRHFRMLPSMSRPANPYDNATCESFLKTLKQEEIHAGTYRDFEDLRQSVEDSSSGITTSVGCIRR
jgi:putative transposase